MKRPKGVEPLFYRFEGEDINHYAKDAVRYANVMTYKNGWNKTSRDR